jgi:hypothetical protein
MVAPAIIAGVGALGGIILGAILGKPKPVYAVVWVNKVGVNGQTFETLNAAKTYQDRLSKGGRSTILIEKDRGNYTSVRVLRAVAAGGKQINPEQLRRMPASYVRPTGAYSGPKMAANAANSFDSNEEALLVSQATGREPNQAWVDRMNKGPYPETDPGSQDSLEMSPLFNETTSSHEWKTEVDSWAVPGKYFPGGKNLTQPEEFVVQQALQYPEDDNADGGETKSDAESRHNTEMKTQHDKGRQDRKDRRNKVGDTYDPDYSDEGKNE